MKPLSLQHISTVTLSIFVALILVIIPPPSFAIWFKPPWVEMVVFFWMLYFPHQFNLIVAWISGLLIDVLTNTPLGEHACLLIIATYFIRKFYQQLQMFPLWQQSLAISFILLIHQFLLFWIQHLLNQNPVWIIWFPPLLSFFLWPLVVNVLRRASQKTAFGSF